MADEKNNGWRTEVRPSPKHRFLGAAAVAVLIWIFSMPPATAAPLKTATTLRAQKTAVTAQDQVTPLVQLAPQFCGQTVNVMLLGDSITRGYGTGSAPTSHNFNHGFRYYLFNSLNSAGYSFDFVGTLNHGSQSGYVFDYDHEGHGGIHADTLALQVASYLNAKQPDLILLHIGTNDVAAKPANSNYAADVDDVAAILDAIDNYSTEAIVVLAQIIDQNPNHNQYKPNAVATFNSLLVAMAQSRISNGDKLILVNMYNALDYSANDMFDWLHPNDSGYQKMAGVWHNALTGLWKPCVVHLPFIQNP